MTTEIATLGGGCFWCLDAVFSEVKGVEKVVPGYSGGKVDNPTYEQVCTGTTGHAEVVQITFNNDIVSFEELLRIFFKIHNPTTLNREGGDIGTQYRSVIFCHSSIQKETAEKVITRLQKKMEDEIVTEVVPFEEFFEAEEYHHDYFKKNPDKPYCSTVIASKMKKVRKNYSSYEI